MALYGPMYRSLLEMSRSNEFKDQGLACRCSVTDLQLGDWRNLFRGLGSNGTVNRLKDALPHASRCPHVTFERPRCLRIRSCRQWEVSSGPIHPMELRLTFLSDGCQDVRGVQMHLHPEAEHLLDWFHITMRLTVLTQIAKGLPERFGDADNPCELRAPALKDFESIKWYLWHGNVFKALDELQGLEMDLDAATFDAKTEAARKLLKGVEELHTYVERNRPFIPN